MSEVISSGPFAKVELDVKERDGRLRAVILKTGTEYGRKLIENEGRILAKLDHPGIVRLYGRRTVGDQPQLILEYVEGIPLSHWIANPAFANHRDALALKIGIETARILTYLHRGREFTDTQFGKVAHGDLSPSNLLVTLHGNLRLIDFGGAVVESLNGKNSPPAKGANLRYSSPDRTRYESVSARDDIFSLGLILWEVAVGRRYWGALENTEIEARLRDFQLQDPQRARTDIPPAIRGIITHCMVSDGFTGYADAEDVLEDMLAVQAQLSLPTFNLGEMTHNFPEFQATFRKRREQLARAVKPPGGTSQTESGLARLIAKLFGS